MIFFDNRPSLRKQFTYLQTIDFDHIGRYDIKYNAYYQDYSVNEIESDRFIINILPACPQPLSIISSTPTDQVYTLTDNPLIYQVPAFIADPDPLCELTYSLKVFDALGNRYLCPDCFDPLTQVFTFHYDQDLLLSGPDFKDFTVEVTGTSGYLNPQSEVASFNLQLKNPCIDPFFVTI